jgi:16S rRNA (cytidine1402-2'-O)-methyltransferase
MVVKGILYIVATPIGNLQDLSPRAKEILDSVDIILAEDTRISRRLLDKCGISTALHAYHEHNERQVHERVVARLDAGENVALVSDAGTPLISDPGYHLVAAAHTAEIPVVAVPGPCSVTAALSVSGLATDRFVFEGFLPSRLGARQKQLEALAEEPRTMVFFEAPHRIEECIADMHRIFGASRRVCVAREITKLHETTRTDTLEKILTWIQTDENQRRGEFVLVVEGASHEEGGLPEDARKLLTVLTGYLPLSQAVAAASEILGVARNELYRQALEWFERH